MLRLIRNLLLVLFFAAASAAGTVLFFSADPFYTASEWISMGRYHRYDSMIADAAAKYHVDPLLLRAVVWRESEFQPDKVGGSGERGLMQVGEPAAADWVRVHKVETFVPTDLFAPRMNLEIGTWYLANALQRWAGKDDPVPFALAEYNAGKKRVDRWIGRTNQGAAATADDLRSSIDFPSTRAYVETIMKRRAYYQKQTKR